MLPDEMEAEKNRKIILAQADEIDILKKNVRDLQGQYQSALIHNKRLIEQNAEAMVIIGHKQKEIDYLFSHAPSTKKRIQRDLLYWVWWA